MKMSDFECCHPTPAKLRALRNPKLSAKGYYKRMMFALALDRLREMVYHIVQANTKMTGKNHRADDGQHASGVFATRGKGVMPSLKKLFPELDKWGDTRPGLIKKWIEEAKSPAYLHLLGDAIRAVEDEYGAQVERFITSKATAADLAELRPVVYPPHKGKRRCKYCKVPHSSELHRFHTEGSFRRTHPTAAEKASRRRSRAADKQLTVRAHGKNAGVPSWVTDDDF